MTLYVSNRETTAVWPQSVQLSQGRPFIYHLEGRTRKASFWEFWLFFGLLGLSLCKREGFRDKKGKSLVFCQTPLGPPTPWFGIFSTKKFTPIFFVENCIFHGRNEFYAWSHFKKNKFQLLFLVIVGQNSQHKRANLNGRTPLDIYSNNFRPSVKHVLGVLE